MKYILRYIEQAISRQKPTRYKQLRIRLSGFDDPAVYLGVCKYVASEYADLKTVSKLALEKYRYFLENNSNLEAIESIRENDWVSGDKSLTYYRNLPLEQAQLILLMGTEAVDDQGGLSDIFYIDPSRIISELRGAFHTLFGIQQYNSKDNQPLDAKLIDKLYRDLFTLVPLDICKLSDIIDSWGYLETTEDFLEKFFESLPLWGLCKDSQWRLYSKKSLIL